MNIILCIKQVPDTTDIKWTENNTIQREGLESVVNPYDVYALESALDLKSRYEDINISALTMGPSQAEKALRKVIALGADKGILLCDKKFAGADTYATAKTIAAAIKSKLQDYDLILCGQFAVDGDTAQTGPGIATFLDIPQVTYVKEIVEYTRGYVTVIRETDEGLEKIRVKLPAVICILKGEFETTRPTINGIIRAQKSKILKYGIDDIPLCPVETGLKGSPTYVSRAFRALKRDVNCKFIGDVKELVQVINSVRGKHE